MQAYNTIPAEDLGKGSGPMNHLFDLKSEYIREVE